MATESDYLGASSGLYGIDKPEFGGRRYDSPEEYFWLLAPLLMVALLLARNIVAGRIGRALGAVNDSDVAAECLGSREPERRGVPESEDLPVYDRTWECRDRSASAQRGRPVPGRAGAAGAGGGGGDPAPDGRAAALLGLAGDADRPAADLPFGRQRLVEIARAGALEPDLLLLDEPMAGLSGAERRELVALLRQLRAGGVSTIIVEHDVEAVLSLADRVAVLDDGHLIALGTPAEVRHDPHVVAAYLGVEDDEVATDAVAEATARHLAGEDGV